MTDSAWGKALGTMLDSALKSAGPGPGPGPDPGHEIFGHFGFIDWAMLILPTLQKFIFTEKRNMFLPNRDSPFILFLLISEKFLYNACEHGILSCSADCSWADELSQVTMILGCPYSTALVS